MRRSSRLFPFLLLLALALRAVSAQPAPATLNIRSIQPIPLDGPTAENPAESLYALVEVSYPQAWAGHIRFQMAIDGHDAAFEPAGSSSAGPLASSSFRIYAGEPGSRTLTVTATVDGKSQRAEERFTASSAPLLRLLDHVDTELLYDDQPLRFVACRAIHPEIRVNGALVSPQTAALTGFDGVTLLTIPPGLDPDRNRIEFSAEDASGNRVVHSLTLYLALSGVLGKGDRFSVVYGGPRSKSGPVMRVRGDGAFLKNAGAPRTRIALRLAAAKNASGEAQRPWLHAEPVAAFPLVAHKEGLGLLEFVTSGHFAEAEKTEKRINLKVIP